MSYAVGCGYLHGHADFCKDKIVIKSPHKSESMSQICT